MAWAVAADVAQDVAEGMIQDGAEGVAQHSAEVCVTLRHKVAGDVAEGVTEGVAAAGTPLAPSKAMPSVTPQVSSLATMRVCVSVRWVRDMVKCATLWM